MNKLWLTWPINSLKYVVRAVNLLLWLHYDQPDRWAAWIAIRWCRPGKMHAHRRPPAAVPPKRQHKSDTRALHPHHLGIVSIHSPFSFEPPRCTHTQNRLNDRSPKCRPVSSLRLLWLLLRLLVSLFNFFLLLSRRFKLIWKSRVTNSTNNESPELGWEGVNGKFTARKCLSLCRTVNASSVIRSFHCGPDEMLTPKSSIELKTKQKNHTK